MTTTVPCSTHPKAEATVKVPRGEHSYRYLCAECLRDERPVVFISLPVPARTTDH